jgi:hypothetical protein
MKKIFTLHIYNSLEKMEKHYVLYLFDRWLLCDWQYDPLTEELI